MRLDTPKRMSWSSVFGYAASELAVDHFLDMGRSATNVIGNSIAAAGVAKWEGELTPTVETAK